MNTDLATVPERVGLCHGCDSPCYETIDRFPERHPRAGEPMRVKGLKSDARIAEFMLSDGSTMNALLCAACAASLTPDDYRFFMRRARASWDEGIDDARRAKLGAKEWREEQKADFRERYYGLWISGLLWKLKRNGKCIEIAKEVPA